MKKKPRILVYNDSFFITSQTFMYQQVKSLAEMFSVDLIAPVFENPHNFEIDSYNKYVIKQPVSFWDKVVSKLYRTTYNSPLHLDLHSHLLLRKLFRRNQYAAIHAHFGYNGLNILEYAKKYSIPLVVTFHGHDASQMLSDPDYRKRLPDLFDYASSIILVSSHMVEKLQLGQWTAKVKIIPCSVDPSNFNSNGHDTNTDKIRIVHTGRLTNKKGVPDLIRVYAKLAEKFDNLELHIAGDGNEMEKCKRLIKEKKLNDQVVLYGMVSHSEVKEILNKADIFVLNSRIADSGDMEGTPVTLLEAMCLGKAVVSTNHAGIPDVVKHGVNGLLSEEKNNDQLEKYLEELITNSELRSKLGSKAKQTIHNGYTTEIMNEKIQDVFSEISAT